MNEQTTLIPPTVGQLWYEQGGIYCGMRLIEGVAHHIITAPGVEHDKKDVAFSGVEEAGAVGELNGHSDWRAPDQEDLMLSWVNAREHFIQDGADSIYWSRSEHHDYPWAVDFEYGYVYYVYRFFEFRVRPFRSVIASPI